MQRELYLRHTKQFLNAYITCIHMKDLRHKNPTKPF